MNISSTTAATSTWAASSPARPPEGADAPARAAPETGPDVVVTLGASSGPSATYDARGRMPGGPPAASSDDDEGGGSADDGADGIGASGTSDDAPAAKAPDEELADA